MQYLPMADRPDLRNHLRSLSLTEPERDLILEFSETGYVVLDLAVDGFDEIVAEIVGTLAPLYRSGHRVQDAWRTSEGAKSMACNRKILETLRLLYGREAFPFQTLNYDVGTQQKTHSDTIHFHCFPERFMAGVWVAFEDNDENNGPLHYYPGSHKLPVATLADVGVRGSSFRRSYEMYTSHYEPYIAELVERHGLKKQEAFLKRGQAIIWSANLLHGGSPIRQPGRTRHSQVTHYYFQDCVYYSPLWSDLAIGKIYYRNPFNIMTNEPVPASYCNSEFRPPLAVRAKELAKKLSRHVVSAR
jgi:ectoine hydroxylase-related dioxygenase (phytanoyl-CoA dioxygenase family)